MFSAAKTSGLTGYTLNRSLRFRNSASAYLNRTYSNSPTSTTKQTFSFWVKRGLLGSSLSRHVIFNGYDGSSGNNMILDFGGSSDLADTFGFWFGGGSPYQIQTTAVFRDPSSWYHVVVAVDTTQATAANRVLIYVNGVQQTSFSTANYPAQNAVCQFAQANANNKIGCWWNSTSPFFDGYLAEVNFIDGQALTPSSFGAYNSYGVWQPIKYSGTYGTNGFYLPFSLQSQTSYAASFNGSSQYLTVPDNNAWAFSGNFTLEAFFYVTTTSPSFQSIVSQWVDNGGTDRASQLGVNSSGQLGCAGQYGANQYSLNSPSNSIKTNTWYHAAMVVNGTTMTLYLNGVAQGSTTVSGSLNNSTASLGIGAYGNASWPLAGQLSNVRITNTAVYTSNFTPPVAALTAVSGTQLLTLQNATIVDNSTNAFTITNVGTVTTATTTPFAAPNIADDVSGNNNHWLPNNISLTAGVTYDSMLDVPTLTSATAANWCTWNPVSNSSASNSFTFSNGNLQASASVSSGGRGITATHEMRSGKWYAEFVVSSWGGSNNADIGILRSDTSVMTTGSYALAGVIGSYLSNGYSINQGGGVYNNGSALATGLTTYNTTDVVQIAFDADNGKLYFGKNGTWLNSAVPSSGTGGFSVTTGYGYLFAFGGSSNASQTVTATGNFGQQPFSYTPPTGFVALNTYNLPTPTIVNGAAHMAATKYTGTGTTQSINNGTNTTIGTTFQPDLVWMKSRSVTDYNLLVDSVRGVGKWLSSNATLAEVAADTNVLTSFNSNGFTVGADPQGSDAGWNPSGASQIAWQWKAGNGSSSNTNGSITSTVSVNAAAGFSVVTYTGTNSICTVGHGLGVAPSMIIAKSRNLAGTNWCVYHVSLGNTGGVFLNLTNAFATNANLWNNLSPTSTLINFGGSDATNGSCVAYCFAAVAGFSKFGSYTGNGSADGPFVYCGFQPRFVMIKRTDSTGDWNIRDTSRDTYNTATSGLFANLSNAENTQAAVDILSNGFKCRDAGGSETNANGGTYIYMAFASNPFKNSLAR